MICPECGKYESEEGAGLCAQCIAKWAQKGAVENHRNHYLIKGYHKNELCRRCGRPKKAKAEDMECDCV